MSRLALFAVAAVVLSACAAPPVVAVKPGYDFSKVGRVALIDPMDYPGQPGSGAAVGEGLEPYLLNAGYDLIERSQVQQLLQEQGFSHTASVDPSTAARLGKVLGVGALILGKVTNAAQAQSSTYMESLQNVSYQPVYQSVQYQGRDGKVFTRQRVAQYDVVTTNNQIPETYTTPASIAFSMRMVDVSTGQVLWTGSVSSSGDSFADAASKAAQRLMNALRKAWPAPSGA